jgi:hypothetical protein
MKANEVLWTTVSNWLGDLTVAELAAVALHGAWFENPELRALRVVGLHDIRVGHTREWREAPEHQQLIAAGLRGFYDGSAEWLVPAWFMGRAPAPPGSDDSRVVYDLTAAYVGSTGRRAVARVIDADRLWANGGVQPSRACAPSMIVLVASREDGTPGALGHAVIVPRSGQDMSYAVQRLWLNLAGWVRRTILVGAAQEGGISPQRWRPDPTDLYDAEAWLRTQLDEDAGEGG